MKSRFLIMISVSFFWGCGAAKIHQPTFNEKMLDEQRGRIAKGEDVYGERTPDLTSDPVQSSLWAKSVGSPYIIRNQKAGKVGDLLTVVVSENSTASSSAKTDTKRESSLDAAANFSAGKKSLEALGKLGGSSDYKNEFKGEGKTDRSGKLEATVQAVVEDVLPNGTLFVRGRKVITVNQEDQEVELTGFVRQDDIRIDNTVNSSLMADAQIKYLGKGSLGDKQRVGWGTRLLDYVWPF